MDQMVRIKFLQFLAEKNGITTTRVDEGQLTKLYYMKGDKSNISPIMTNSESTISLATITGKPATALNILRETIMGRELFDYAFKTFKALDVQTPEDLFRTMEDASAVDLTILERVVYTNEHADISIVKLFLK